MRPYYQGLLDRPIAGAGELERWIFDRSELDSAVREAEVNLHINMTCHTDDEAAQRAYRDFVEKVEPELEKIGFELDKKLAASPFAADLDRRRYEVLLRDTRADVEIFRDENVPLQTQDTLLGQEYRQICGAMTVRFRGEERTLPQMARFLEEPDRPTREEAWRGTAERRFQDRDKIDEIYDKLVDLRGQMAANAGFENFRDFAFRRKHRFDYTPADCEAFHRAAERVCVPLMRRLSAERAKALGVSPLRPWDMDVDVKGRPPLRPFDDADELVEKSSRILKRLDPELGGLFDTLRGGDCLDLATRKGKAPGGYQALRERSRRPFIFMNAAGMQRDVETVVHEAGHAFHSLLCKDEPLIHYRHAPLEFAEVASMSMELLSLPYLDEFYSADSLARAPRTQLEGLPKLLCWIATIDAFQHWVYTHPGHSRRDRHEQWLAIFDRFGDAVDWTGLEPLRAVRWHAQLHLFAYPFYYIEYGIAQLGALGMWRQFRRDPARALAGYKNALSLGGSRPLPELFSAAGLPFDFGPATMEQLMGEVQDELAKLPA